MRRSEVSTDDKTADNRCFPCASAQGASPVTSTKNTGTQFLCFFLWVRYAGIEERQNKEKIKKQAITLFFLRKLWYIYIADINCRCRLAVWRQLPKLISAGPTPVTCSNKNGWLLLPVFLRFYVLAGERLSSRPCLLFIRQNYTELAFSFRRNPPRTTL